jgi:hypothetical protein
VETGLLLTIKKVTKKTINTTLEKSNHHQLSIQFTLDGFSFCITNLDSKKTLHFCEYTFEKSLKTPDNLVKEIETIFKENSFLQEDFKEILVIHQNNLSALVPDAFFNEKNLKDYLGYTIKTLATDFFAFDSLPSIQTQNVYIPFVNVNNYLFQNFGEFEYKHASSIFIEKLLQNTSAEEKTMYVDVRKQHFSIVILEKKQLLFSNSFSFETKEDFIYYILFTAEQLGLDADKFPLFFTGEIEKDAQIYKITYQYIRNIHFLESENPIFIGSSFSNHTNYILLG